MMTLEMKFSKPLAGVTISKVPHMNKSVSKASKRPAGARIFKGP